MGRMKPKLRKNTRKQFNSHRLNRKGAYHKWNQLFLLSFLFKFAIDKLFHLIQFFHRCNSFNIHLTNKFITSMPKKLKRTFSFSLENVSLATSALTSASFPKSS